MVSDEETLFASRAILRRLPVAVEPSLEQTNLVHRRWDDLDILVVITAPPETRLVVM